MCTENILSFPVHARSRQESIGQCLAWIQDKDHPARCIACANPHSLVVAGKTPRFAEALKAADMLVPDGTGILLASSLLGLGIRERITGSDLFQDVSEKLNQSGGRVFFLGTDEPTLALIRQRLHNDYPGITWAGGYSPPYKARFDAADTAAMISAVNASHADVLWVGMTAPKQETWVQENRAQLLVPLVVSVGAVFDFYSGRVKRSGPVFRRLGLEWLPRLVREPKRLWQRNLVSTPIFLWQVFRQRFTGR